MQYASRANGDRYSSAEQEWQCGVFSGGIRVRKRPLKDAYVPQYQVPTTTSTDGELAL